MRFIKRVPRGSFLLSKRSRAYVPALFVLYLRCEIAIKRGGKLFL